MAAETAIFPNLSWVFTHQASVAWIYLGLILCIGVRVWVSLQMVWLSRNERKHFLERIYTLSEATGNIALLFGVIGTLIGITVAVTGRASGVAASEFLDVFSNAFGTAVYTTVSGGLTYVVCFLLSAWDWYLAGDK